MMKRSLFIIALLACVLAVACNRTETRTKNSANLNAANINAAPASANVSDNTAPPVAARQTNEAPPPQVESPLPPPDGLVNDYTKVIDNATKARLEATLNKLRERAAIEFAVVTVNTTGGEDIFNYSLAVARGWGIGVPPHGDGLLLLVAIQDRRWRIQVSRSLEEDLPNDEVARLGSVMTGPFRAGKYGEGLTKCVETIIAWLGERRGFKPEEVIARPSSPQRKRRRF